MDLSPGCFRLSAGDMESAVDGFESLIPATGGQVSQRSGSWTIPLELIEQLAVGANPQSCREAVLTLLRAQQP
jgi:hypothetical protein